MRDAQLAQSATTTPKRLWSRDYFLAFIVLLAAQLVFITLLAYMALYAIQQFQVQDTAAGFAASSFILGASIARLLIGKYLDFVGRKRILVITLSLYVVCSLLYPVIDIFILLIVVRIVQGMCFGIASTTITTAVIDVIPSHRLSEGLGYISLAGTLTNAIGPVAAIQLSQHFSSLAVFGFTTLCTVIALLVVLPMHIQERQPSPDEYARRWRLRITDMLDGRALAVAAVAMMCMVGYGLMMTFVTPYAVERDIADTASIFFLTWAAAMLMVRLFAGRVHDRYGDNAVIPVALVSMASGLSLVAVASDLWHFILAGILGGLGHGVVVPSLQAISIKRSTAARIPLTTATYYLALDTGVALGPVALGFLVQVAGYPGLFLAGGGIVLASMLVYWLGHGRHALHGRPART